MHNYSIFLFVFLGISPVYAQDAAIPTAKSESTSSAYAISKDSLPCIAEACIGDSIELITANIEPSKGFDEILSRNINFDQEKISQNEFSEIIKSVVSEFKTGDMQRAETSLEVLEKKINSSNLSRLSDNASWLAAAQEVAKVLIKNGAQDDINQLAKYLVPVTSAHFNAQYFWDQPRQFDSEFYKLINKVNPVFCRPLELKAAFLSKSGYPTFITAMPDIDGKFKIAGITRIFEIKDRTARDQLRHDLSDLYKEFEIKSDAMANSLVGIDGNSQYDRNNVDRKKNDIVLQLIHPMSATANGKYESANLSRWTKGWLDLKQQPNATSITTLLGNQKECKAPKAAIE